MDKADRSVRVEHYRSKGEKVRVIAESIRDTESKRILMSVAGDYLMLAEILERTHMTDPLPASE